MPLQAASHVDTVVFDKTGTLTAGKPAVVEVRPLPGPAAAAGTQQQRAQPGTADHVGEDAAELLRLAAAVERGSTHPLAKAIAKAAAEGGDAEPYTAADGSFVQEPGSGVTATVAGRRVSVGTLEWVTRQAQAQQQQQEQQAAAAGAALLSLDEQEQQAAADAATAELAAAERAVAVSRPGHILVYVGVDGRAAGTIEIADELRPDAAATVAQLQRMGVRAVMLSGDQPATAHAIADSVGIPPQQVYAGVKPAGKAALVQQLQAAGRRVAMVGDGVNDAAALAQVRLPVGRLRAGVGAHGGSACGHGLAAAHTARAERLGPTSRAG